MILFAYFITGLVLMVGQVTLAADIALFGIKPNLLLFSVAIFSLRVENPWLFIYAALVGLGADVFSHGLLGVHALAFMGVYFLGRVMRASLYANTPFLILTLVMGLSFASSLFSSTLLWILDSDVPWLSWVFLKGVPAAIYTSIFTPLPLLFWHRLEKWYALEDAG